MKEELKNGMDLRALSQSPAHKKMWTSLVSHHNKTFLDMSESDEKNLSEKMGYFRLHQQKYAVVVYCLKYFHHNNAGLGTKEWLKCLKAVNYLKENLSKISLKGSKIVE